MYAIILLVNDYDILLNDIFNLYTISNSIYKYIHHKIQGQNVYRLHIKNI